MRLYYRPQTGRPVRVAWLLEELGVDYEAVAVTAEQTAAPEHRARNPLGRVPVVEFDDGTVLFESAALLLQIADLHLDAGLIGPPGSPERGLAYQWVLTAMTEGEGIALRPLSGEPGDVARERFGGYAAALGDALDGLGFLVADRFGVADIATVGALWVGERRGLVPELAPGPVRDYYARLRARPALHRAAERTDSYFVP